MYSEEQLNLVQELAANLMSIRDIAVLTGVDVDVLRHEINKKSSPLGKAYLTGKAGTVLEIKKQEIALAKLASPAAVENVSRYISEMDTDEV